MSYATFLRSSDVPALGDDARKDDDNVAFLAELPLVQQAEWLTRLRWLRVADRLAENELVEPAARRFAAFCAEWRALAEGGDGAGEHAEIWRQIRAAWWSRSGEVRDALAIASFGEYLDALRDYTVPKLEIRTLADHDRMCLRITGNLFGVFPYLLDSQRSDAAAFGMLDQMMNNLRDVAEDAAHGLCWFPRDLLADFGVPVDSLFDGSAIQAASYREMIHFWIDEHIALARRRATSFLDINDLHPSLAAMGRAFLKRYARIEQVFRACDFNYLAFPRAYWGPSAGAWSAA